MLLNIKLIIRSWWRNKTYFLISLFSLTIGLACTNLLVTFFIHEYNIESTNPNRENIYAIRQDSPMEEGELTTYTTAMAAEQTIMPKWKVCSACLPQVPTIMNIKGAKWLMP